MSWAILLILSSAYMAFSLALISLFGSNVILEYTRFAHDNKAHLYIPRTILDNGINSRLANVGTVWLPLYHLAIMPLTVINPLYVTGLAGSMLNAVLVAATASTIYLIIKGKLGVIAAATFGISTYSLIHASSSYMVPIGQFLAVAGTYYLLRYIDNSSLKDLTRASVLIMLGTLARYEDWLLVAALVLVVILKEIKGGRRWTIPTYIIPTLLGIAGWVIYNWVIFGNPMEFMTHPSPGASGYYFKVIHKLTHPWSIDVHAVTYVVSWLSGPASLALIPLGIASLLVPQIRSGKQIVFSKGLLKLIVLVAPLTLITAAAPSLLIIDLPLYFFFVLPYMVILSFLGLRFASKCLTKIPRLKSSLARVVSIVTLLAVLISFTGQLTIEYHVLDNELVKGYSLYVHDRNEWNSVVRLWGSQGRGYIMVSSMLASYNLSVLTGLSPKYIIDEYDMPTLRKFSPDPWNHDVTVVVIPSEKKYSQIRVYLVKLIGKDCYIVLYYEDKAWRNEFLKHYELYRVLEPSGLMVYALIRGNFA